MANHHLMLLSMRQHISQSASHHARGCMEGLWLRCIGLGLLLQQMAPVAACGAGANAGMDSVMVVDMGTHMLRHPPGSHLVIQILAPGLERRACSLPPLTSSYSTPGKLWQMSDSESLSCSSHACWL